MFATIDWVIIIGYLVLAFVIGILMKRLASKGLDSYFLAGRSLPWWWLGTSMVATTFAADTPLAITGIVANDGIAGNWLWWATILTYVSMTIFFARKWTASRVLTDVELISIRYDGRSAKLLRIFKAFFLSIVINGFVLGWVFKAMSKITDPFIKWEQLLGPELFVQVQELWPSFLIFSDFNNTLTVIVIFMVVVAYSSVAGIRGVILTDLFQFVLAMFAALLFAVYAIDYVGGLGTLFDRLHHLYPEDAAEITSFFPDPKSTMFPFKIFLIYISVLWWSQYFSDGSGYLAQRINTAKSPKHAEAGSMWFTLANYGLRTWPWIIIGLVALVAFPLDNPTQYHESMGQVVGEDREMGYPVLMKLVLPAGLLGLTFTSLMAAFMSTVDTHINWGASYLVNDVYKTWRPQAGNRELVLVSRLMVIAIAILSVLIASQMGSIEAAWKFFFAMGAGMGLPQILRWVWWRANAWTEIGGLSSAFIMAIVLHTAFPGLESEYILFWDVLVSVTVAITATLVTQPVGEKTLQQFARKVRPLGWWKKTHAREAKGRLKNILYKWGLAVVACYSFMFSIGYFIKLDWGMGLLLMLVFLFSFWPLWNLIDRG